METDKKETLNLSEHDKFSFKQEGSNSVTETVTSIEFVSKNGKRFTLYVEKF